MSTHRHAGLWSIARRPPVREHEILRVFASLTGADQSYVDSARQEVLKWAQKRCGGQLPDQAWKAEDFEYFSGGRDSHGLRIIDDGFDIWAIRTNDPDKSVAGRVWTNEITIVSTPDALPKFLVRQVVSTIEEEFSADPHAPGFMRQIADNCGIVCGIDGVESDYKIIRNEGEADAFIGHLVDSRRTIPIFVLSVPEDAARWDRPLLDPLILARAVVGLARVVVIPAHIAALLRERLGKAHSVFDGAVRSYLPGFSLASDPYDHRLILRRQLASTDGIARANRWLQSLAAQESVRSAQLGRDILPFSSLRSVSASLKQRTLSAAGASDTELLVAADARIKALEKELADEKTAQEYYASEYDKAIERAIAAEDQSRASAYRIQSLLAKSKNGDLSAPEKELPQSWADFASWADTSLSGKLVLTPTARRKTKNPVFDDFHLAARCLIWLSETGRDRFLDGGGSLQEEIIEEGIKNSHCGSDEFDFDWQGRRYTADWHIKNGGNTRDPIRCLRIYYGWDEDTNQIIVADLPAHRRTGAT